MCNLLICIGLSKQHLALSESEILPLGAGPGELAHVEVMSCKSLICLGL